MHKLITLIILPILLCSCAKSPENSTDEGHLEHHIPPHQPHSYMETVDQLKSRFDRMALGTEFTVAQKELEDIIIWLPDLAGDSELKQQDWEKVNTLQKSLLQQYQLLKQDSKNASAKVEIDRLLTSLEEYKEKSKSSQILKDSEVTSVESADKGTTNNLSE